MIIRSGLSGLFLKTPVGNVRKFGILLLWKRWWASVQGTREKGGDDDDDDDNDDDYDDDDPDDGDDAKVKEDGEEDNEDDLQLSEVYWSIGLTEWYIDAT